MTTKKNRGTNYSVAEIQTLLSCIERNLDIIENKRTDAVSIRDKERAWLGVASNFAAQTATPRSVESLRQKWDTLRSQGRKYYHKKIITVRYPPTGGGGHSPHRVNEIFEKVLVMIGTTDAQVGAPPNFDSDSPLCPDTIYIPASLESPSSSAPGTYTSVCLSAPTPVLTPSPTPSCSNATLVCPTEIRAGNSGSDGEDWLQNTPQVIRRPMHAALRSRRKRPIQETWDVKLQRENYEYAAKERELNAASSAKIRDFEEEAARLKVECHAVELKILATKLEQLQNQQPTAP